MVGVGCSVFATPQHGRTRPGSGKLRTPRCPITLTAPCWTTVIDVLALRRLTSARAESALAYRQLGADPRSDIPSFIPTTAHHRTRLTDTSRTIVPAQRHCPTAANTTRTAVPNHPDLRGHQSDPADGDRQTPDGVTFFVRLVSSLERFRSPGTIWDGALNRANARRAVPGTELSVGSTVIVGVDDWGVVDAEVVEHDCESGSLATAAPRRPVEDEPGRRHPSRPPRRKGWRSTGPASGSPTSTMTRCLRSSPTDPSSAAISLIP